MKSSAAPCTLLLLLKRGETTLLFHHKLQTRNHGDTPHKKDLMMLMIERCAMVAIEVLRGKKKSLFTRFEKYCIVLSNNMSPLVTSHILKLYLMMLMIERCAMVAIGPEGSTN